MPIVFRRQYPTAAFAAAVAVGAVQVVAFRGPSTADVSVLVLLYSLAVSRSRRASAPGLAICVLGAAVATVRWRVAGDGTAWQVLLAMGLVSTPALLTWLAADSVRWRRGYYAALEEKAQRLERERDALAQVAAAAERARIARELHDIVAHHVSGFAAVALAAGRPQPDVMVMDVRMPRLGGVRATQQICAGGDRPRVLMLTTFDLDEYAFAALKAAASGLVRPRQS